MFAEIITIGDEILIGQITDTNSKWIAEEFNKIGVSVYQIISIQDDKQHILDAISEAEKRVDIVIITGGLGPTKDDITKHTLAEYFNSDMAINDQVVAHIKAMFEKMNIPFSELNRLQGLLPTKCEPIINNYGTASGMWFEENGKIIVSLPGVPHEMKGLMSENILPKIQQKFKLPFIIHNTIMTYGIGESSLALKIENWEDALPSFIKLAYLPSSGCVKLRLTANGLDEIILKNTLKEEISKLHLLLGDLITGTQESETVEYALGELLKASNSTLAIAESCTGGAIASAITSVPGSSAFFKGAIIAYTAEIKIRELNVSRKLIDKHSVVSAEVAKAMAKGIQEKYNVDYAIATTGNAGPTTDLTDKSVGVVFIGIATPKGVFSEEYFLGKPRVKVIERAVNKALNKLREEIIKNS